MTTATAAQNIPFGRGYLVKLPRPNTVQIGGYACAYSTRTNYAS